MSRTAFRAEDVLLLQTTRLRPQSSGGQRSPRRESTFSIDVVDGPERLVVPYADLMGRFRTDDAPALIVLRVWMQGSHGFSWPSVLA